MENVFKRIELFHEFEFGKWEVNDTNNASFLLETQKLCIFHIHVNIVQQP